MEQIFNGFWESSKKKEHKVLLLGFKGSGKKRLIRCLSKQTKLSSELLLTASIKLPQGDKMRLYGINPEKYNAAALKPVFKAAEGAILLINTANINAKNQLGVLVDCCLERKITNISVGIWYDSNKTELIHLEEIYAFLNEYKLTLPVVVIENANADDIDVLLNSTCAFFSNCCSQIEET